MNYEQKFVIALGIAMRAHATQEDKSGAPYILHPLQVAFRLETWQERIVAILHDVVEDTNITLNDLRRYEIPEECVLAVAALTRTKVETHAEYIDRVIAFGHLAMKVKLADLQENMRPDRKHPNQEEMSRRYKKALARITEAMSR